MSTSKLGEFLRKKGHVVKAASAPEHFLDTGFPNLNEAISGDPSRGLPTGRMVELIGKPSHGKTMLATQLMISAQQQGGFAAFFDHEGSYDSDLSVRQGLSLDDDKWMYYPPITEDGEVRSFEDSIVTAQELAADLRESGLLKPRAPIIFVFDSLATMTPMSKLKKGADKQTMADNLALARATSSALPAFTARMTQHGILSLFINQVRDNLDMYSSEIKTPGGNAPEFYASVRILVKASNIMDKEDKTLIAGKHMTAKLIKNKINRPGLIAEYDFLFRPDGSGEFDFVGSYLDYLYDLGALDCEVSGTWITFQGEKFQGKDKLKEKYRQRPNVMEELKALHEKWRKESLGV